MGLINRTVIQDSVKTTIFNESILKRIQLINYEKFLIETLQNNSFQLRNLLLAEQEVNSFMGEEYYGLKITFSDLNTCINLNSTVKRFRQLLIKNENNSTLFNRLFFNLGLEKNFSENFYDRLVYNAVPDFIDIHYKNFHWFTFNVADIFITIGIIFMVIMELFNKNQTT